MKKRFCILISFFFSGFLFAQQTTRVDIPGSQMLKISSEIVRGQEYVLHILLPGGYPKPNKQYPVLYLMDSQWDFPLLKSLYGQHYYDGFIPEMIIVGVTWGGINPNPDSLRARDYTPTREDRLPQSGGAEKFLSFIRNELFPFVQARFSTDTTQRTLMGCSLGGLFTMYTLFTRPSMFSGYVAASPAYGWDKEVLYRYEKEYFNSKVQLPAKLYMTIGDVERGVPGFEKLSNHLLNRNYPQLKFKSRILENTGHSGTKTEGFGRGLQFIYERASLPLTISLVGPLTGRFQLADGSYVEIRWEQNRLFAAIGTGNRYPLLAETATDLYSKSEFLQIHFIKEGNTITGLQLVRYNRDEMAKKLR